MPAAEDVEAPLTIIVHGADGRALLGPQAFPRGSCVSSVRAAVEESLEAEGAPGPHMLSLLLADREVADEEVLESLSDEPLAMTCVFLRSLSLQHRGRDKTVAETAHWSLTVQPSSVEDPPINVEKALRGDGLAVLDRLAATFQHLMADLPQEKGDELRDFLRYVDDADYVESKIVSSHYAGPFMKTTMKFMANVARHRLTATYLHELYS
eukprot:TRINITY_DN77598_c0_g1_i1.p1 TRINITY_DN77598_c0_g1~~TRINITY_DN77598_c0_g1_i1.p1  ORF type:complete len:210 (+),score=39.00 TRINITY_DN77598_c0_g1_i1:92-721(+)